jgi:antitoxin (DNA-binding transcriptional repressor) of toxin-antitoxin stability system
MHDAKTNFSRLVARVEQGEKILICRDSVPVAVIAACGTDTEVIPFDANDAKHLLSHIVAQVQRGDVTVLVHEGVWENLDVPAMRVVSLPEGA